ncbi:HEAT repeat domain-containing protein [Candidatus Micrarchaeota archaeon]|nr:HEAT repeat domain-containing protein [Candidatus Micrarchaeota archaeon]
MAEKEDLEFHIKRVGSSKYSASERAESAEILGQIGGKSAVPALINVLKDEDEDFDVRWRAANALGRIGDKSAVLALINALKDEQVRIRWCVADALGLSGDKSAVPALINVLKDEGLSVRRGAAQALGKIGEDASWKAEDRVPAIEALKSALKKEEERDPQTIPPQYFDIISIMREALEVLLGQRKKMGSVPSEKNARLAKLTPSKEPPTVWMAKRKHVKPKKAEPKPENRMVA